MDARVFLLHRLYHLAAGAVLVLLPAFASALTLENFPNARVVVEEQAQRDNYVLALGNYQRIDGLWRITRERRLSGQLQRKTLELPPNQSASDGYRFYRRQLERHTLRELYSCQGRDCGTSNSWANNHFGVLQLYGLDQHQYYGAYEVTGVDEYTWYVSLYAVMRGNRRVFMQVEVLRADQAEAPVDVSAQTWVNALERDGYLVLPGFSVSGTERERELSLRAAPLAALVELLQRRPDWRLALVGHDYGAADLARQRENATGYAEHLRDELLARGIAEDRLEVYGLGSLAPAGRGDRSARIEVVLLPAP